MLALWGLNKHYFHIRLLLTQMVLIVVHYELELLGLSYFYNNGAHQTEGMILNYILNPNNSKVFQQTQLSATSV